jgi:uroporphyrinogen decarboxylase
MTQLSKRERVDAALKGEAVDRVPVSAWRHFIPEELSPVTLAQASLKHFYDFDWDWLKVNPRATYYAEAWGVKYDFRHYDSVLPRWVDSPLHTPADLEKIGEVPLQAGIFVEQLELIRLIKLGIHGAHFLQTVFSPLSVLAFLVSHPADDSAEAAVQAQYSGLKQYLHENPRGAHEALRNISASLARYAAAAVDAGASGLFFAIVKLARQNILSEAEFAEFGRPYDLAVLQAVQGAPFNLLHTCGPAVYFDAVLDYPVHAINWAAIGQNNPSLGEAARRTQKTLVGGVDELGSLQVGTPDAVTREAFAAIQATGGRRLLLTPGCGVALDIPAENLHALRRAADLAVAAFS